MSHTHLAAATTASNTRLVTFSHHHVMIPATVSNADLMPSHAGLIAFSHNHLAAAATASMAPVTMLRNVSEFFHSRTMPATSAATAAMIRPIGLAISALLSSHCAAA